MANTGVSVSKRANCNFRQLPLKELIRTSVKEELTYFLFTVSAINWLP